MTDFRASRRGSVVLLAGVLAALVLGPAAAASASLGSVPAQVAAYVADGGMVARLSDIYGKNAAGAGIDFDGTTKAGPITRVYEWTAARLRNATTDHPVQLTNNWVVPVTIADKPVGLATIWINPQTVAPELADFAPTAALATAMAGVPATAALVRDTTTHAWLALADGTVTPLVAGTSGITKPTAVGSLKLSDGAAPLVAARDSNTGLGLVIGAVGIVVVVIVVALVVPRRRRPKLEPAPLVEPPLVEPVETVPLVEPVETVPLVEPVETVPLVEPVEAAAAQSPTRSRQARSARVAAPRPSSPVTKPVGSKPGSRTPTSTAASTKPRTQKPPTQKPPKPPLEPEG